MGETATGKNKFLSLGYHLYKKVLVFAHWCNGSHSGCGVTNHFMFGFEECCTEEFHVKYCEHGKIA